jgi:aryl sulfotransferase
MPEQPAKRYKTTFFDNARWHDFTVRPDDVVVATPYKAGTTWTQNIVLHLIFQDLQKRDIGHYSPWLEMRFRDWEEMRERLDGQTHRRVIKSHIPFDGLLYYPELAYLFVARDPRDIFMSMWNFYRHFGDEFFDPIDDPDIPDLPRPPATQLELWDLWISRGCIDGETDGYPFWSCFHQMQTWWDARHRPNILFLHYANMLADLRGEIARIAAFLKIDITDRMLDDITELCTFSSMRRDAAVLDTSSESNLKGGARTFFNKGINGRWRELLDDARLAKYEEVASRIMDPDCKRWIENGGPLPA